MEIKSLNIQNFDSIVFEKDKLVLVDFYANWCGPCKMLSPIIEEFAKTTSKDIIVGKLDVDQEEEIAKKFNVFSIPTLMVVKNGEVMKIEPGFKSLEMLEEFTSI